MENTSYDIISVGSNLVDLFVDTGLPELKSEKDEEKFIGYPIGAKILINETHFETGGGGTNTAVAFSRLGLKTGYLGNISTDDFGHKLMDMLEEENISVLGTRSKQRCGFSVILDSKERNRTILVYKGASNNMDYTTLNLKSLNTKWFYFSSMGGKSYETQKKLISYASKHNIKVAFNPSWYQAEEGRKHLMPLIEKTELLVMNREEAQLIAETEEKPWEVLSELGPRTVCITAGKSPVKLYHDKQLYELIPHALTPKEVTGAGDAFASGLVFGIIKGLPIEDCLKIALVNSQSVIMHVGAKNKLLSYKEAQSAIKKQQFEIRRL